MILRLLFRLFFIAILAAVALGVVGVLALPKIMPPEKVKALAIENTKKYTGRDLTIAGDVSFSFWPNLSLEVNDVTFANAEWSNNKEMVRLASLSLGLKLLPLLTGKVDVDKFIMLNPVIVLEKNSAGKGNWEFATKEPTEKVEQKSGEGSGVEGFITGVSLSNVRIVNGTIVYADVNTGDKQKISDLNLEVKIAGIDKPISLKGDTVVNGQKITLDTTVDSPMKLKNNEEAKVFAKLSVAGTNVDYSGALRKVSDDYNADGDLKVDVSSLKDLMSATGSTNPLPPQAPKKVNIQGKVSAKGSKSIAFSDAVFKVDNIEAKGSVAADMSGKVPEIKAAINIPLLDLQPYLIAGAPAAEPANTDLKAAPKGWNNDPIVLAGLTKVNADILAKVTRITLPKTTIDNTEIALKSNGGKLTVDLKETNLYDGKGKAYFVLDGRGDIPSISQQFTLEGINVGNFLKDFYHNEQVEGTGNVSLDVNAMGRSQLELISNADGKGSISFKNGKLKGIDVLDMLKQATLASATIGNLFGQAKETQVTELSATFDIKQGVVHNNDLNLVTPLGLVTGEGEVNLPSRLIRYRVTPKLDLKSANAEDPTKPAQPNEVKAAGFSLKVPVLIEGSFDAPQVKPDTKKLLTEGLQIEGLDPNATPAEKLEAIKKGAKNLEKGVTSGFKSDAGSSVDGVLQQFGVPSGLVGGFLKKKQPAAQPAPAQPAPAAPVAPAPAH
ncbi:MAG: AsmA family protein [Proteobacteria bacterium]|nr:AsmA family protein [Pseudomonadota bacterium]